MEITMEYVEKRIKELEEIRTQNLANASACMGAIQIMQEVKAKLLILAETNAK